MTYYRYLIANVDNYKSSLFAKMLVNPFDFSQALEPYVHAKLFANLSPLSVIHLPVDYLSLLTLMKIYYTQRRYWKYTIIGTIKIFKNAYFNR